MESGQNTQETRQVDIELRWWWSATFSQFVLIRSSFLNDGPRNKALFFKFKANR